VTIRLQCVYFTGPWIARAKPWTFVFRPGRNVAATKAFFRKAIRREGSLPQTLTFDGCAASHRAMREMKFDG
jgi:transposase-like protein